MAKKLQVGVSVHLAMLATAFALNVDNGGLDQAVQSGYAAWSGAGQPNNLVESVFTDCLVGLTTQTVAAVMSVSGGSDTAGGFFTYTPAGSDGYNGFDRSVDLINDYYFGRRTLTLTLSGIRKGDYALKTYHHEANNAAGAMLINLGLTCGESAVSQSGVSQSCRGAPLGAALLPFTADGSSDATLAMVRQSEGEWDNVALNGFELHKLGILRVDIGKAASVTQAGFTPWHFDAPENANSHSMTFTGVNLNLGLNTFTATVEPQGVNVWGAATGGPADDTQTGNGGPMDNLASGAFFARRDLVLTLCGLRPGTDTLVTFHKGLPGILDTALTDANGTQAGTVLQSDRSSTPGEMGIGDFVFRSDGVNPVVLRLHTPNDSGHPDNAYLNGFTLEAAMPPPPKGTIIRFY